MIPNDQDLYNLAQDVTDARSLNWEDVEKRASSNEYVDEILALKAIQKISEFHRAIQDQPPSLPLAKVSQSKQSSLHRWGHLQVLEKVGEGGFAKVYRAMDLHLEREVALKLFPTEIRGKATHGKSIIEEGRLLARVSHPNVVTVYGAEERDGTAGIWMAFVKGSTLSELLGRNGVFGERETVLIGMDVCRALASVHAQGIIHRDIKAQNIMREVGGNLILVDFGIGLEIDREPNKSESISGTPFYLAPEVLHGERASIQSDVYSLGVLLFHLVTGDFPVKGENLSELSEAHLNQKTQWLRDLRPELSRQFISIVEKSLAKDPVERFMTIGQFGNALTNLLSPSGNLRLPTRPTIELPNIKKFPLGVVLKKPLTRFLMAAGIIAILAVIIFIKKPPRSEIQSIAVVPFDLQSDNQEVFVYGKRFTRNLIDHLSHLPNLKVISYPSASAFQNKTHLSPRYIAEKLQVEAVLLVAVRQDSNMLKVGVELNDPQTRENSFKRTTELFINNREDCSLIIAEDLLPYLKPSIIGENLSPFVDIKPSNNLEAIHFVKQAEAALGRRNTEDLEKAEQFFDEALRLDPSYARAMVGLAKVFALSGAVQYGHLSRDAARTYALELVDKVLANEPSHAEAITIRAFIRFWYQWKTEEAEKDYRQAISIKPSSVDAHKWYADLLMISGRSEEALYAIRQAVALDPLSPSVKTAFGMQLFYAGEYDDAAKQLREALELDSKFVRAYVCLGACLLTSGETEQAIRMLEKAEHLTIEDQPLADLAHAYAIAGQNQKARDLLKRFYELRSAGSVTIAPYHLALVHLGLGEIEAAKKLFNQAIDQRRQFQDWLFVDPRLRELRDDKAWFENVQLRMGFLPK